MQQSPGITAQPAASVLTDVDEFYFGGAIPWYHGTELNPARRTINVYLDDPESAEADAEPIAYELTGTQIKTAYAKARRLGYDMCCDGDMRQDGIGLGCANDLDLILQTACYGEAIFG